MARPEKCPGGLSCRDPGVILRQGTLATVIRYPRGRYRLSAQYTKRSTDEAGERA